MATPVLRIAFLRKNKMWALVIDMIEVKNNGRRRAAYLFLTEARSALALDYLLEVLIL